MNQSRQFLLGIATVAATSLAGCAINPSEPTHAVNPAAPPAVSESVVQVPLTFEFAPYQTFVNNAVPGQDPAEGAWGDIGGGWYNKHLWVRDPIVLSSQGNELDADTRIHYRFALAHLVGHHYQQVASCGYDYDLNIVAGLKADLKPMPTWSIAPNLAVKNVDPGGQCLLTVAKINGTGKILEFVRNKLNDQVGHLQDELTTRLNFQPLASQAWVVIEQPVDLGDNAYFTLNPDGAAVGNLQSINGGMEVVAGITAKPVLQVGPGGTPPAGNMLPLPALTTGTVIPEVHIELPITVTYDALSQAVNSRLAGHMYPLAGHQETVTTAAVYGSEGTLILQIKFDGDAHGTLYLTGTPVYNAVTHTVYIQSLDYTVSTKNEIVKLADWLLHTRFQDELQAEAYYDISTQVDSLKVKAQAAINRSLGPHADLKGTVTDVTPLGFVLGAGGITVYLTANGQATVAFH